MTNRLPNRWTLAILAIGVQVCLGSIYGWSVFKNPLIKSQHWSETSIQVTFTLVVVFLGFGCILGGLLQDRFGPRKITAVGGLLYGAGHVVAAFAVSHHFLQYLYWGYGVLGGTGMGMGHICPIAMLVKWFPDRRGMMVGFSACGFGFGSLVMGPFAAWQILHYGVPVTFLTLGTVYAVLVFICAQFFLDPPANWKPVGWHPRLIASKRAEINFTLVGALATWQFYVLLLMHFMSVSAGDMIISQASPIAQEMVGMTILQAAGIVGVISVFNGLGRIFWSSVSDYYNQRARIFILLFAIQAVVFFSLPRVQNRTVFSILLATIGLCYGGAIGTLPSIAADYFGSKAIGAIYGLIVFGGNFAGIPAPLMIAHVHEKLGTYVPAVHALAAVLLASIILPLIIRPPAKVLAPVPTAVATD